MTTTITTTDPYAPLIRRALAMAEERDRQLAESERIFEAHRAQFPAGPEGSLLADADRPAGWRDWLTAFAHVGGHDLPTGDDLAERDALRARYGSTSDAGRIAELEQEVRELRSSLRCLAGGAAAALEYSPHATAVGAVETMAAMAVDVEVVDEVRCRRLVIVDEDGVDRIVGQATAHGAASLRVQSGDERTGTWAALSSMHESDGINASCYVSVGGDIVGVLDGIGHDNGASGHLATASFDGADSAAVDVRIGRDGVTGRAIDQ